MINKITLSANVRHDIQQCLKSHSLTLKDAMDNEAVNTELASIIWKGLPIMVRKFYAEEKMQSFFWEKRDLLFDYISTRLQSPPNVGKKKKKK